MKKSHPSRLREVRLSRGFSQIELAVKSGVCLSSICSLETGKREVSRNRKRRIADTLGLSIEELFPERNSRGNAALASGR